MRLTYKLLAAAVLLAITCYAAPTARAFREISWNPGKIETGSPCLFRVRMTVLPASLIGLWQGHSLTFVLSPNQDAWYALAGVDVAAKPGEYQLQLQATLANGSVLNERRTILVTRARYPKEKLHVPNHYVEPDAETMVRIEADHQLKRVAFSHEGATAEWSGDFRAPVDSKISEAFGTRRTFNGKLESIHRGADYHAAPQTPITAANDGEVVLARELFYEGKCVIIDHGQQFTTIYMHLSHLGVSEGQHVKKGDEIGLSGATGRVTGPHLHIAVRWQGAYLDPVELWNLPLPQLHAPVLSPAAALK